MGSYEIPANPSGLNMRLKINEIIMLLMSMSSGETEPDTTIRNMLWFDEANDVIKIRNAANDGWDTVLKLTAAQASVLATARTINGIEFDGSGNINIEDRKGDAIASAETTNIGIRGNGDYIHITGTTSISSFGTADTAGIRRTLYFYSALTVVHDSATLACPGAVNIDVLPGTIIDVVAETTTIWRVLGITHPSVSFTRLGYLSTLTSNVQTQLNAKASLSGATFTGAVIVPAGTEITHAVNLLQLNSAISALESIIAGIPTQTVISEIEPYTAGSYLEAESSDVEFIYGVTSYTKMKEIYVPRSGTVTVKFDILHNGSNGETTYGRIYINGVAVGTVRSTTSITYVTFTENISVQAGDLVQLYICGDSSVSTSYTYCQKFQILTGNPISAVAIS